VLVPWPNGKFPRYICKNCKTEVIENNGKFRYFNNQFCGPTNDCDFELVKSVMKS
jgi:hypothetical protein